ncbi:DUF4872 domain-containing protein, partial [Streptomyces sp. SP18CS02]|uniref:DUF4872 domain-containing protein n=1 Tax=Streptomyces sp. SP18CS02 TaxID=3002531 RepID=UPI002E7A2A30
RSDKPWEDLPRAAVLMERAGTGGALFRNLYRDFLAECAQLIDSGHLPDPLLRLRERGVTVVPHGVSLGLGGADRPDEARLAELAAKAGDPQGMALWAGQGHRMARDLPAGQLVEVLNAELTSAVAALALR